MNSDDFFEMQELPKSMCVIGGGYIGCELAGIMNALGVKVTLVVRSIIMREMDRDIVDLLMKEMEKHGIEIKLGTNLKNVRQEPDGRLGITVVNQQGIESKVFAEKCLYAAGRPPLIDGLNLENTAVKTEKGVIIVDEF
jgi:glutathione reductase (NADPH)